MLQTLQNHQESKSLNNTKRKRSKKNTSKKDQTKQINLVLNDDCARAIMDSALDAIIMVDKQNQIAYMNPSAEKIYGYPKRIPTADPFLATFRSEKLTKYLPDAETLLQNSSVYYGKIFETNGIKRDGTKFPIELAYAK